MKVSSNKNAHSSLVAYIGVLLLSCLLLPIASVFDVAKLGATPVFTLFPLVFGFLFGTYACLIAWTALSTTHWSKRLFAGISLTSVGIGVVWFADKETGLFLAWEFPTFAFVAMFAGLFGFLFLFMIKHLTGAQLNGLGYTLHEPCIRPLLYCVPSVLVAALIVSGLASRVPLIIAPNDISIGLIIAVAMSLMVGAPAFILSRYWNERLRRLLVIAWVVLLCFAPAAYVMTDELSADKFLSNGFWSYLKAGVGTLAAIVLGMLVVRMSGLRLVAPIRRDGKWDVINSEPNDQAQADKDADLRLNFSLKLALGFIQLLSCTTSICKYIYCPSLASL